MLDFRKIVAAVLTLLMLSPLSPRAAAADQESLVSRAEIDRALRSAVADEEAAREAVRSSLTSGNVVRLAREAGIDLAYLDKAASAVGALEGPELEEAAARAAELDDRLAGGATITISLVALLLIVIIVILLAT